LLLLRADVLVDVVAAGLVLCTWPSTLATRSAVRAGSGETTMAPHRTTVEAAYEHREVRGAKLTVFAMAERLSLAQAAATYAAAGVPVFPCVPGTKRPLTRHGFIEASADPQRIARWWQRCPEANIGMPTGQPDGFDVLDVDVHPSGSGFPALRRARQAGLVDGCAALVRSPSGGVHLYFPGAEDRGQASWALPRAHVDFRGVGGYVIVLPSRVLTGDGRRRGYALLASGRDPHPLDAGALRRLLAPAPRHPRVRSGVRRPGGSGQRLAAWLALQPEGNRNRALYWAACRQAEAGVPEDEARHVLGAAAARTGLGEREIEATLASAFRTLGRRPAPTAEVVYRLGP
jgi:hypothetical protein